MPRRRRGWAMQNYEGGEFTHSSLTVALLEPVLLHLISLQPRHGYSLLSDLEPFNMGTIHPGMVYRTLRDFEDLGWINSQWDDDQTQGPPRRVYSLTSEGNKALSHWQEELRKTQQVMTDLLNQA